jgi:hypothetical protein
MAYPLGTHYEWRRQLMNPQVVTKQQFTLSNNELKREGGVAIYGW